MDFLPFLAFALLSLLRSQTAAAAAESSSSFSAALETLQKQIGYEFNSTDLLRRALTHSSYSRENNRALSILGLSAIEAAASLRALRADADASAAAVSSRISAVAGVDACAAGGERLGLQKVVRVSPKTNSSSPSVVCGAYRGVFGAVAVDSGKIDVAGDVFWGVHGGGGAGVAI